MTIRERIIDYLSRHPEGVDDDELTKVLDLKYRQQANQRCRELESEGLVKRRLRHGKIHNFWVGGDKVIIPKKRGESTLLTSPSKNDKENWFWEGNVQSVVVHYLASKGYSIRSVADTAKKQPGKDIIAEKDGKLLWVTVKGYPKGTKKTRPTTQASHWFKQAMFDIIEYRGESQEVELALALPDFSRYRTLVERIKWFESAADFKYIWIQENGRVIQSE